MFQDCLLLFQAGQTFQDDFAHSHKVRYFVVNLPDLTAGHIFPYSEHLKVARHGGLFFLKLLYCVWAVRIHTAVVDQLPPPRHPPPVSLPVVREVGEGSLEALEKRVVVVIFGNLFQQRVWHIRQGSLLYFCRREPRPYQVGRCCPGLGEHAPLEVRPPELFRHLAHGLLIVLVRGRVGQRA